MARLAVIGSVLFALSLFVSSPVYSSPLSWTTQDLPAVVAGAPSPGPPALTAQSCPSVGSCVAVGTYTEGNEANTEAVADVLSGGTWSESPLPVPSNTAVPLQVTLTSISCASAQFCVAVGSYATFVDSFVPLAEVLSGTTWTATALPLPLGDGIDADLNAVSCASSGWCLAVDAGGFAEILSGTTWTETALPDSVGLNTVSCVAVTSCVGTGNGPSGPVAVTLSGATWTEAALPGGSEASGISCVSLSSCIAVWGDIEDTLAGVIWTLGSVPFPTDAQGASLTGISCPSATSSCVAVGTYYLTPAENGPQYSLAETVARGVWSYELLGGGGSAGVSCTADIWCVAVGSSVAAEVLSDGSWTSNQLPGPAPTSSASLSGVSCPSARSCTAVGTALDAHDGFVLFDERLSGDKWSTTVLPQPADTGTGGGRAGGSEPLAAVSCPTLSSCVAVGSYTDTDDDQVPLAEVFGSGAWKAEALPLPPNVPANVGVYLSGISCVSRTSCIAVGSVGGTGDLLVETFSAPSWHANLLSTHGFNSQLTDVACVTLKSCVAVGSDFLQRPIAATLSGSSWKVRTLPEPYGDEGTVLRSISCTSPTDCLAVGFSGAPILRDAPTAETLSGTTWTATNLPVTGSPNLTGLYGSSCASVAACFSVGVADGVPLVEALDRITWTPSVLPLTSGDDTDSLNSVSCPSTAFCVAVGQGLSPTGSYALVATYGGVPS
jgi:hypothetical protein